MNVNNNFQNGLIVDPNVNSKVDGALEKLKEFCEKDFFENSEKSYLDNSKNYISTVDLDAYSENSEFINEDSEKFEDFPYGNILAEDEYVQNSGYMRFDEGEYFSETSSELEKQRQRNQEIAQILSPVRKKMEKGPSWKNSKPSSSKMKRKFSLLSFPNKQKKTSQKQQKMNNSLRKWREYVVPYIRDKLPLNMEIKN